MVTNAVSVVVWLAVKSAGVAWAPPFVVVLTNALNVPVPEYPAGPGRKFDEAKGFAMENGDFCPGTSVTVELRNRRRCA